MIETKEERKVLGAMGVWSRRVGGYLDEIDRLRFELGEAQDESAERLTDLHAAESISARYLGEIDRLNVIIEDLGYKRRTRSLEEDLAAFKKARTVEEES